MKTHFLILIIVLLGISILTGCTKEQTETKSMEQLYQENGIPIKVEHVTKQSVSQSLTFHAVLTGFKESTASAKVADKVEKIHYGVGSKINKDDVIISFPTDNPAAQYNQAKVSFEHSNATLNRMQNLYESGGISLQDFENAKTQFKVAKANWQAVRQAVKVKAPISGTITQINVQETDNVASGDKLFTVSQTQKLKGKLWIPEDQIMEINNGDKTTATWNGVQLFGKVVQVDMSMNSKKQAFGIVAEFQNSNQKVKSGVNAEITIESGEKEETIFVERKNIIKSKNQDFVFIAKNGVAEKRELKTGRTLGLNMEILSGLNAGDVLITEGQYLLKDGDKINIVN
jgi:membrane fusion protein, multidrug efflux system